MPSTIKRSREIAGVINLAIAIFLLLSLSSYHPSDPSFTHFVAGTAKTHNLIGSFGSYGADSLLRLFGLGALWFPVFFAVIAFKYFLDANFRLGVTGINAFLGLLIATSGLAAVALANIPIHGIKLRPGGLLGDLLDRLLGAFLSHIGAYIVLVVVLIIALMILIDLSIVSFITQLKRRVLALWFSGTGLLTRLVEKLRERKIIPSMTRKKATEPVIGEAPVKTEILRPVKASQTHFDFVDNRGVKFSLPPLTLLDQVPRKDMRMKRDSLIAIARILETKLADYGVEGKVVEVKPGPVITMYELEPAPGVKINKITNLSDDLALALRAPSVRIIAPIPGKAAVGIEIPNNVREPVQLLDVLDHEAFLQSSLKLPIALGVDIVGSPVIADLIRMPHLLIAGTTGSGKSVCLNAMICSILFKAPPDDVKFLLIDPKRLELSAYERIPHLLHPVVVNPKKASLVLRWAVEEMERRYEAISELGVKGIDAYNRLIDKTRRGKAKGALSAREKTADDQGHAGEGFRTAAAKLPVDIANRQKLPYIVIVIDELADLMMVAQRNVEESLARLAQMARAAGIHLILATQRPSVDVITGIIKANFPTRISFQVSSKVDSRTIIDQHGAEKLLGAGDMLFIPPGTSNLVRIHGAFVSDKEIDRIVAFICNQATPAHDPSIAEYEQESPEGEKAESDFDEKYDAAVELVADLGQASISLVQRYMKIGYNRAARMIERMESEGIVGPSDGVKPRKVLIRKHSK
ncbi:MAG: DNA translocase FtsK 4TM domain-containing protein [Syntrophales bacterium]|nr:DNA translocase FtsK 4TM domain-containing protein [Syntrophales bacterium]